MPAPARGEILLKVLACGVCRTDLHIVDGELQGGRLPIVPGHEIVGTVVKQGEGAERFSEGGRVGVPWLGWSCGGCDYCRVGRENLCDRARFTGPPPDGAAKPVVAWGSQPAVVSDRFRVEVKDVPDYQ